MWHEVEIIGRLGKDPEARFAPSGQQVCSFSVASSREYSTSDGEKHKETVWFRVSVWGKQAEACNQYLKKGSMVLIKGRLQPDLATGGPRIYQKQDGSTGTSFEINASTVRFLSTAKELQQKQDAQPEDDNPF